MTSYLVLALVALAALAVYAGSCAAYPFARCLRCEGSGRRTRPDGKVWRTCRRCKGSGRRVRLGRRVWEWSRRVRDGAE